MSGRELFLEFQQVWNLERVKSMTLEEYTGIGGKNQRDDFTYWIEHKLKRMGSFGGRVSGTRYCIYMFQNPPKKDYEFDSKYAWKKELGKDRQKAFDKVKQAVCKIVELSKNNMLDEIDLEKEVLFEGFKWKIAFMYQNVDDMRIMNIYSKDKLDEIIKKEFGDTNLTIPQIYKKLISKDNATFEEVYKKGVELYEKHTNKKFISESANTQNTESKLEQKGENMQNTQNIPLNQILYGPPGTGKTYNTIDKALEILGFGLDSKENSSDILDYEKIEKELDRLEKENVLLAFKKNVSNRENAKALFDYYKEQGQIEFITFHQSFSYEEFVEGIKPNIDDETEYDFEYEEEYVSNMQYIIKSGIFKEICKRATKITNDGYTLDFGMHSDDRVNHAEYIFQQYCEYLQNTNKKICTDCNYKIKKINKFVNQNEVKSIIIQDNNNEISLTKETTLKHYPKFVSGKINSINDFKPHNVKAKYYIDFFKAMEKFEKDVLPDIERDHTKPYILIIDEINRGNISKIFGELITLIEPNKRLGSAESLQVRLPYSGELFGVPSNLYIIGTMNTADKSIALIDTALRRRFDFVEMMPQPEKLGDCEGVNLQKLLESMNNRIEFLLDREHTLGHSYFLEAKNLGDLQRIFQKNVIPLLQEYFYDDYAKINAVLNDNGMVKEKEITTDLGSAVRELIDDKKVYKITESSCWKKENFQKIYDSSIKLNQDSNAESTNNDEK